MKTIDIKQLEKDILNAINSGKDIDYVFNGEDEILVDIFYENHATDCVMQVLRNYKLIK